MKVEKRVGVLPRNWERAFGYDGEARYVAFYWTPVGDEAMYDDGRVSGDSNWRLFLTLRHQHPELDPCYNVGDSDVEADHWLLLNRETRDLAVLPRAVAHARPRQQWPTTDPSDMSLSGRSLDAELTAFDWDVIREAVQQALDNVESVVAQIQPCDTCFYSIAPGWLQAEDGGFDPCPVCSGWGFLPAPEESTILGSQRVETRACQPARRQQNRH
jgi:hypothetical protein